MTTRIAIFLCLIHASQAFAVTPKPPLHHRHDAQQVALGHDARQVDLGHSATTALIMPLGGQTPVSAVRAPPALYQGAVAAGTSKANAPFDKIFKLGIVAGAHIAIGAFLALSVGGACPGIAQDNPGLQKLIFGAIGLPTGLLMTIVTGAELFTGNTALVSAAYMEGKVSKQALAKNWIASYLGNFVGSLLLAFLAYKSGTLGAGPSAVNLALAKCSVAWDVAFVRGVLCNWLVCMAVYMASGCSTMIGKMSTYH
jgi:formate transporter